MKPAWRIAFGIMIIVTPLSVVYGYVQTVAAQQAESRAHEAKHQADMNAMEADKQRAMAERAMLEAEKQRVDAEDALKQCQQKKK